MLEELSGKQGSGDPQDRGSEAAMLDTMFGKE